MLDKRPARTSGALCGHRYWLATGERQGHPVRIGYVTDQPDAWLAAIANGYGIALAPACGSAGLTAPPR